MYAARKATWLEGKISEEKKTSAEKYWQRNCLQDL